MTTEERKQMCEKAVRDAGYTLLYSTHDDAADTTMAFSAEDRGRATYGHPACEVYIQRGWYTCRAAGRATVSHRIATQ